MSPPGGGATIGSGTRTTGTGEARPMISCTYVE